MAACPNCGHERDSRFCPQCGQNDRDYTRSLWRLIADVIKEAFEVDGRLPRTLRPMFLRPGELAAEFSRNRRASYIAPIRSYLFASILFFLGLTIVLGGDSRPGSGSEQEEAVRVKLEWQEAQKNCDKVDLLRFQRALAPRQRGMMEEILNRQGPSTISLCGVMRLLTWDWKDAAEAAPLRSGGSAAEDPPVVRGGEASGGEAKDLDVIRAFVTGAAVELFYDWRAAKRQIVDNLPLAMFVTLPAYALLLKLFFFSSRRYYTEHFVFAMHLHTFSFLVYTVLLLLPDYGDSPDGGAGVLGQVVELVFWGLLAWVAAYSYLALRRYYRNGRLVTACKWLVLGGCYFTVLLLPGLLFAVAATVVFL